MLVGVRDPYYAKMRLVLVTAILVAAMYIQPYGIVRSVIGYVGTACGSYLLWRHFRRRRAAGPPAPTA
jgi:hypothetical protein